jgi:hypothetical protein
LEEVKIHSGSRIRLKRIHEGSLPEEFVARVREYAHKEERIQAVFVFALQAEGQPEQPSMAIALKTGFLAKKDEVFLEIVDELQLMLPDDLSVNLYRFGASDFLAGYCVANVEPMYLRTAHWLEKQRKKYR